MISTETTDAAVSDAADPARRYPFLAVVGASLSEATTFATELAPGVTPIGARRGSCPSCLRATLAAIRPDAPFVVATDSAAAVRDADHVVVTDGGVVLEAGAPGDLLAVAGRYAHLYGAEVGATFDAPGSDVADE